MNGYGRFAMGSSVADHERIWAKHQTLSDPVHVEAAKVLRRKHLNAARPMREPEVAARDLTDYDKVFGIDFDGGVA